MHCFSWLQGACRGYRHNQAVQSSQALHEDESSLSHCPAAHPRGFVLLQAALIQATLAAPVLLWLPGPPRALGSAEEEADLLFASHSLLSLPAAASQALLHFCHFQTFINSVILPR